MSEITGKGTQSVNSYVVGYIHVVLTLMLKWSDTVM
jgi:hypothetical protein